MPQTAPNRFFAYVKRPLKQAGDVPLHEGSNGQPLTSSTECASALAAHFASVFVNDQVSVLSSMCTVLTELDSLACGMEEVCRLLANNDGKKPAGHNGPHPFIPKFLSAIISPPSQ